MSTIVAVIALALLPSAANAARFINSSAIKTDELGASIIVRFNCQTQVGSKSRNEGIDRIQIQLEPTTICSGIAPDAASSSLRFRPAGADDVGLLDIEYDGNESRDALLTFNFDRIVDYSVVSPDYSDHIEIRVTGVTVAAAPAPTSSGNTSQLIVRTPASSAPHVINLASYERPPTIADLQHLQPAAGETVFYSEIEINGRPWYRLRLGNFSGAPAASDALERVQDRFPDAWIEKLEKDPSIVTLADSSTEANGPAESMSPGTEPRIADANEIDELMQEARQTMVAGDISRAIQIYTKVLRFPPNPRQAEAQEYLALAREKNGQIAHAKAEYERYLAIYPNNEGAIRVSQRLAALISSSMPRASSPVGTSADSKSRGRARAASQWRIQTFFSQYYRRDVNQLDENEQTVSQSALYSDINLDARRRGERFDFSSRLSGGYRNDFLPQEERSDNQVRMSYAYVGLDDAKTGLRGRIGRQSRSTGGVLGRYDGLYLGYQAAEKILLNMVAGYPVNSSTDSLDTARRFYGASISAGPFLENLEVGAFVIDQSIGGIQDRQAIGTEFRYFGDSRSLWGLVDFDTSYNELGRAFLQGSWRMPSRLSLHASLDRRYSPFLSSGNALIGQQLENFEELTVLFSEEEIRALSIDRSAITTSYTVGASYPLNPRYQINMDASRSRIGATRESGGVPATPSSTFDYYSTNLVASSIFTEGDVSILGVRYSSTDTTDVISLSIDTRFPVGRALRLNPRLRVDYRDIHADGSSEVLITPGLRMQYRWNRKIRIDFEAGRRFSKRQMDETDVNRDSYYLNLGYQLFF